MLLGDGTPFPKEPSTTSQKQRVDDYWKGRSIPGAPPAQVMHYAHPCLEYLTAYHMNFAENVKEVYDPRDDEMMTEQYQRMIATSAAATPPMGVYQHMYAPPQITYAQQHPSYTPQPAYQAAQFPVQQFQQQQASVQQMSGSDDTIKIGQLKEALQFLNTVGVPLDQFLGATRSQSAGNNGSSSSGN